jgi:serine kinase of HPr protein (carbohydrate metabolism regulator)
VSRDAAGGVEDLEQGSWDAIHASALVIGEIGVIIRGPSGAGKSRLTLALLGLAHDRRLFARLIADDRVWICARNERILARGAPRVQGLIEQRGYGIVTAPTEPCAIVRLIVDLASANVRGARLPDEAVLKACLAGLDLPCLPFDDQTHAIERAQAILRRLDKTGDKIMTGLAHFA